MTLDYAVVNFEGRWSTEAIHYVALSRVRSKEGLQLKNFKVHEVKASALVQKFYQQGMALGGITTWDEEEGIPAIEKISFDHHWTKKEPKGMGLGFIAFDVGPRAGLIGTS
jgi:hypothetical protein